MDKVNASQVETQRQLQPLNFQEGAILSRDIPKDSTFKSLQLRLSGSVVTTFGSGTPVADSLATFDNIIPRIDVVVGGNRTVKSVRPHLMRMQQLFTTGILGSRRASAGAAPAPGNLPTVDGGFAYGTTGQFSTVAESILISFEMVYCNPGTGREMTWLNLQGASSAELRLTTAPFARLLGAGNTAPVAFSNSTFVIDVLTREVPGVARNDIRLDWKQTTKDIPFAAETTDFPIDIGSKNILTGIMLFARDGAAGSATTATGKMPSNLLVTKLNLKLNGSRDVRSTTFQALQDENRQQYGVQAPYGSNVSLLDGIAHMNFLTNKDLRSALDLRAIDNTQLFVTTNSSGNVSYTAPAFLSVMTEEIVSAG